MRTPFLVAALSLALAGCASVPPAHTPVPARLVTDFEPETGGFGFANGLLWDYDGGQPRGRRRAAPDDLTHRCVLMARAARQFHYAARFDASLPRLSREDYALRVERVLASDPRREEPVEDPVVVPGFANLRSFSSAYEGLLRDRTASGTAAYMQRGNWRMIVPFSAGHQRRTAEGLLASLAQGHPPIVHLVNFPDIDVNHVVLVFAAESDATRVRFSSYDPNQPGKRVWLSYDRELARFELEKTPYFPGGPLKAYEIYDGRFY